MRSTRPVRPHALGAVAVLLLFLGGEKALAQCEITGPPLLCGGSAELCGPEGPYFYEWTDPTGNPLGTERCLTVTAPGTYSLVAFDYMNGLPFGPCTHTVGPESCEGPAPAPANCPLTPAAWQGLCQAGRHARHRVFDSAQMAQIAECVDARSKSLEWKSAREGLLRTLKSRASLRERARRQFAGVLANVCVQALALPAGRGPARGLDPATALQLDGFSGSVGDWLALADDELMRLERKSSRDRRVKAAYRALIRAGWQINHGQGMGPVCGAGAGLVFGPSRSDLGAALEGVEAGEIALAEESLDEALLDPEEAFTLESMEPNPASGPVRIGYAITAAAAGDEVFVGVYDVSGRLVRELDRGPRAPGRYQAVWDGRDAAGNAMRNGAYFVMGRVGGQRIEGRLILLR